MLKEIWFWHPTMQRPETGQFGVTRDQERIVVAVSRNISPEVDKKEGGQRQEMESTKARGVHQHEC